MRSPGCKCDVFRGILPKLADIVNLRFIPAQQADAFLVREIVEAAGSIDRRQQRHVFGEMERALESAPRRRRSRNGPVGCITIVIVGFVKICSSDSCLRSRWRAVRGLSPAARTLLM